MAYKLDGNCITECPINYESKDLYGDKNICSLIVTKSNCSNYNCTSNGKCSEAQGSFICVCNTGFYGEKCEYDQINFDRMKGSLTENIKSIRNIDSNMPLTKQQLDEINKISNLIKSVPELATDEINKIISTIVYNQLLSMLNGSLLFQNYTFSLVDSSLEIKNAL
jgi:hypothetical protein